MTGPKLCNKLDDYRRKRIIKLAGEDISFVDIAKMLGISKATVAKVAKANMIK